MQAGKRRTASLRVGDVVELNSGGDAMTVTALKRESVECSWRVKEGIRKCQLPRNAVKLVHDSQGAATEENRRLMQFIMQSPSIIERMGELAEMINAEAKKQPSGGETARTTKSGGPFGPDGVGGTSGVRPLRLGRRSSR
jgi:uncharacterized protein YodC (DUF2158 family)